MLALMGIHIDYVDGAAHCSDDGCFQGLRLPDYRNHHPIVILVCLIVEKLYPFLTPKGLYNFLDIFRVTAFAEIGHTFHYLLHASHLFTPHYGYSPQRRRVRREILSFDLPLRERQIKNSQPLRGKYNTQI